MKHFNQFKLWGISLGLSLFVMTHMGCLSQNDNSTNDSADTLVKSPVFSPYCKKLAQFQVDSPSIDHYKIYRDTCVINIITTMMPKNAKPTCVPSIMAALDTLSYYVLQGDSTMCHMAKISDSVKADPAKLPKRCSDYQVNSLTVYYGVVQNCPANALIKLGELSTASK